MVLLQIAMERIANPYQRPMVEELLKKGLLRLDPDVQPFSDEFADYLRTKERTNHATLERWERVAALHSWRYGRRFRLPASAASASSCWRRSPASSRASSALPPASPAS